MLRSDRLITAVAIALAVGLPSSTFAQSDTLSIRSGLPGLSDRQIDLGQKPTRRYAVVVGNNDYEAVGDLRNSIADARLMSRFLTAAGYEVIEHFDLDKRGFEALFRRMLFDVDKDTEVVFYYAGHGVQIGSGNYLVPTDARLDSAYDVSFETVSLDSLVQIIGSRARSQVAIFDSCRNNPFTDRKAATDRSGTLQATSAGFSFQSTPINSLLAFSTSPGAVAFDGDGRNSPFTAALVETASGTPDQTVSAVLERVRRLVYERTSGQQIPWESSTLLEPASFEIPDRILAAEAGPAGSRSRSARAVAIVTEVPEVKAEVAVDLALETKMEREVDIGPALAQALDLGEGVTVNVPEPPVSGRLNILTPSGIRVSGVRESLSTADLENMNYSTGLFEAAATTADAGRIWDSFEVRVNGEPIQVGVNLVPNDCDREAGDHLDPDGVGLTRYNHELDPEPALAACEAAVAEFPDTGRFHYQLGRALRALKRTDEARAAFERARDLGHVRAWNGLGVLSTSAAGEAGGFNWTAAPDEAMSYFRAGVEQGDPYAYYSLGRQLLRYDPDPSRKELGFNLLTRAQEFGHTFAMNELGAYFLNPDNEYADAERGFRYLRESAERGDMYGFNNLAIAYRDGLGVTKDAQAAFEWFRKASDVGHPTAPTNIGRLHATGALPNSSAAVAVEWYALGLSRGDPWGGANGAATILVEKPQGYTLFDAAAMAGKAIALDNPRADATARKVLANLPANAIDGGAQILMNDLGAGITVDGAFGPASITAMEDVMRPHGGVPQGADPTGRLEALARGYWETHRFRADLF